MGISINKSLLDMLEAASKDRPLTRQEIASTFHVADRVARGFIENLRDMGYPVCGTSDQPGYWLAKTYDELGVFLKNYTRKAKTINRRAVKMQLKFLQEEWSREAMS